MGSSSFFSNPQKSLSMAAVALLIGVPTTLTQIADPIVRFGCTLVGVLTIFLVAWKLRPPEEGYREKIPTPPPLPETEPDTKPDPPEGTVRQERRGPVA